MGNTDRKMCGTPCEDDRQSSVERKDSDIALSSQVQKKRENGERKYYCREHLGPDFVAILQKFKDTWKDKKKVLICEPTLGYVNYQSHESCWDLAFSLARYEEKSNYKFFKTCLGRMLVAYSREQFAEVACDFDFDYVFFIDDDHIWDQDMFEKLEKHFAKYDIIAPLCTQRLKPYKPVLYRIKKVPIENSELMGVENKFIEDFKKGDLVEPDAIGFGAAIIKVDLFKKMQKPWFFNMAPIGEDILFTMKATQELGAKIVCDTSVDVGHLEEGKPVGYNDYLKEKNDSSVKEITNGKKT